VGAAVEGRGVHQRDHLAHPCRFVEARVATPRREDNRAGRSRRPSRSASVLRRPRIGRCQGSPLGSRHHLRENLGKLALPLVCPGHLFSKDRRMVHGQPSQDGDGTRCSEHGDLQPQPTAGTVIHHSDRGSQYTSVEFGSRLREEGLLPSMGSVADAYDNSMAESFVSTLKRELIHRNSWPNRQVVRTAFLQSTSKASTTPREDTPPWGI
jgi:hypothetical protein